MQELLLQYLVLEDPTRVVCRQEHALLMRSVRVIQCDLHAEEGILAAEDFTRHDVHVVVDTAD